MDFIYSLAFVCLFAGLVGFGDYILELLFKLIPSFGEWAAKVGFIEYEEDEYND